MGDSATGGFAVKRLLNWPEPSDLLAMTGDNDLLAALGEVEQFSQFIFGFKSPNLFYKRPLIYS